MTDAVHTTHCLCCVVGGYRLAVDSETVESISETRGSTRALKGGGEVVLVDDLEILPVEKRFDCPNILQHALNGALVGFIEAGGKLAPMFRLAPLARQLKALEALNVPE